MDEHRRTERRSALLRVEVTEYLDGKTCECPAQDVSPQGIFLLTKKTTPFHLGGYVTLRLHAPGRDEARTVAGEIVRVVDKGQARKERREPGIGVEFVEEQGGLA